MTIAEQVHALTAIPLGAAAIVFGAGFFLLYGVVIRHVIRERAERRAMLRDLAARVSGGGDD